MEAIVFIILQIFFVTQEVLKLWEYYLDIPSFSRGIFTHVTREQKYLMDFRFRLTNLVDLLERKTHLLQGFEYCLNLSPCADHRRL